jgi:prepilin-type processing-associated H-X9-DG protein
MLLPALNRARDQAKTAQCLSNLRQIGMAVATYIADNKGYAPPACYLNQAASPQSNQQQIDGWPALLVYGKYLPRSYKPPGNFKSMSFSQMNSVHSDPITNSALFCPSGELDFIDQTNQQPTSAVDGLSDRATRWIPSQSPVFAGGAYCVPSATLDGTLYVDCWYGINAVTDHNPALNLPTEQPPYYVPGYRIPEMNATTNFSYPRATSVRKSSQVAYIFDGFYMNLSINPGRLTARHMRKTSTNILFFDGHAAGFPRKALPGYYASAAGLTQAVKNEFIPGTSDYAAYRAAHTDMPLWFYN